MSEPEQNGSSPPTRKRARRARPAPPPPPPATLVNLLRSDEAVLAYFRSLRDNLDADVLEWKDKATKYKRENEKLQEQLRGKKNGVAIAAKKKAKTPRKHAAPKKKPPPEQGEPIQDSMLELESSSEEENGGDTKPSAKVAEKRRQKETPAVLEHGEPIDDAMFELESSSDESMSEAEISGPINEKLLGERRKIFALLQESYVSLQRLGISLVDVQQEWDDTDLMDSTDEGVAAVSKFMVVPRDDELLVRDLYDAIHSLTRIQLANKKLKDHYPAFVGDQLIPCCSPCEGDPTDRCHPALEGKRLLSRALMIIDTFCSSLQSQEDWDAIFTDASDAEAKVIESMRVGLRGRKQFVERLVDCLTGEISETWACHDRSQRLASEALHFDGQAADDPPKTTLIGGDKVQGRLSTLIERCVLGQLCISLYLSRNDPQRAASVVLNYILSTAPVVAVEDYPKLQPVLSLVILEGLIFPDPRLLPRESSEEELSGSWFFRQISRLVVRHSYRKLFFQMFLYPIHLAASFWKTRTASSDDRIHDVALVECAAYERLLACKSSWLNMSTTTEIPLPGEKEFISVLISLAQQQKSVKTEDWSPSLPLLSLALQLRIMLLVGPVNVKDDLRDALKDPAKVHGALQCLSVSFLAARQYELRRLDGYRAKVGISDDGDRPFFESLDFRDSEVVGGLGRFQHLSMAMECAASLGDGVSALRFIKQLIQSKERLLKTEEGWEIVRRRTFEAVGLMSLIPVVRVINLERRRDRMKAFMAQAVREKLTVVKAVTFLKNWEGTEGNEFGCHAFDGRGRLAEAYERLTNEAGSLEHFVETQWRPHDLKAFDRNAPDDESLVRMTPSECACALSHIASWKGIVCSLQIPEETLGEADPKLVLHSNHLLRLFKISGFAEGPSLLPKNSSMPPAPVCVILEDDAILVDRFAERLARLLKELPRDFHFCSLGYGRPKSAPIIPFGSEIGIPSMLWYLTGYCVSQAGAEYLLESLPVTGPVDSWIGLKMTSNWDNVFGEALGVGSHTRPLRAEPPARKDLCRILQFRAFCVLHPLCTQKVGTAVTTGRSWRQRDTDVEYSGDKVRVKAGRTNA